MTTGTIPHGRAQAHGARERYQCKERAWWGLGQALLQLELARKELAHKVERTHPQLADDANPRIGGRGVIVPPSSICVYLVAR
jgi:hypothetical protein